MNHTSSMKLVTPVILLLFFYSFAHGAVQSGQHSNSGKEVMAAEMDEQHNDGHADAMTADQQKDMFLEKKEIDNYIVSFHAMRVDPGMEHGGSHNFMVKIEQDGAALGDVIVNSKVIGPDGSSETKRLVKMGDWYMSGYDLGKKGKHQLIILFKTADGKKHTGGVYYQEKDSQ